MVRTLIYKKDADINATENTNGWSALIYAIWSKNQLTVADLIEAGGHVNIKDKNGWTAKDHANATGDFGILLSANGVRRGDFGRGVR